MYTSDYGYVTRGGMNSNCTTCLNLNLYDWSSFEECYTNNWLKPEIISGTIMLTFEGN